MRLLFSTTGSHGDLFPLLSVAGAARAQGAECVFAVHADQVPLVEAAGSAALLAPGGLEDLARDLNLSPAEVIRRTFADPNFLFRAVLPYRLADTVRLALEHLGPVDAVAATFQAEAGRLFAEIRGIPAVLLLLQPMMELDPAHPPVIPDVHGLVRHPGWLGTAWNRLVFRGLMAGVRALHGGRVNAARRALGLGPRRYAPFFQTAVPPAATLALYPQFLQQGGDGPQAVGHCAHDGGAPPLDPELRAFLAAGPAPVVFTLGSNARWLDVDFYAQSLEAARRLGRRAVLLTGADWQGRAQGDDVIQRDAVAHEQLFPRAACVVHHGGIGTLLRATEAGVPHLVVPFGTDQPDNAARLERLGVGLTLPAKRYDATRAAVLLRRLLDEPGWTDRARALAVRQRPGAAIAAGAILGVARAARSEAATARRDATIQG